MICNEARIGRCDGAEECFHSTSHKYNASCLAFPLLCGGGCVSVPIVEADELLNAGKLYNKKTFNF